LEIVMKKRLLFLLLLSLAALSGCWGQEALLTDNSEHAAAVDTSGGT
jgi:hypothetical protein